MTRRQIPDLIAAAVAADLADRPPKADGPELVWVGRTDLRWVMPARERRHHPEPLWADLLAEANKSGHPSTRTWIRYPDGRLLPEQSTGPAPAPEPIEV